MVNKTSACSFQLKLSLIKCTKQHLNLFELKDNMLIAQTELLLQIVGEPEIQKLEKSGRKVAEF